MISPVIGHLYGNSTLFFTSSIIGLIAVLQAVLICPFLLGGVIDAVYEISVTVESFLIR